ncbi:hypothetical protein IH575_00280 [Candidatus Dojkabacteria bacterium]|nr:hypothetical protein [Candidatus Dojkabacteria bacterium]
MNITYLPLVMNGETTMADGELISGNDTFTIVTDISKYQPTIDYKKMRARGCRGVGIRLTGNDQEDKLAEKHWKSVQDADMIPIGYGWMEYRSLYMKPPVVQAQKYLDVLYKVNGSVENVLSYLDYEQPNSNWPALPDYKTGIKWLTEWYSIVDPSIKRLSGLYGNRNTIDSLQTWYAPLPFKTSTRPLWIAAWVFNRLIVPEEMKTITWRPNIKPWAKFSLWQVGLTLGEPFGVGEESKELDLDMFPGTAEELRIYAGYKPVVVPPPVPPTLEQRVEKLESEARLHGWSV